MPGSARRSRSGTGACASVEDGPSGSKTELGASAAPVRERLRGARSASQASPSRVENREPEPLREVRRHRTHGLSSQERAAMTDQSRILVVDDQKAIRDGLRMVLEGFGY